MSDPVKIAQRVQKDGLVQDSSELASRGIDPLTPDAVPYYAAWTRTDIALAAALAGVIATDVRQILSYARICALCLILIAAIIAFRAW